MENMSDASQSDATESGTPFRDWQAIANFMPIVSDTPLRVGGHYHLNRRSGTARLQERVPPGINPTELILDLVIDGDGLGGDWVRVDGEFAAQKGQYRTVRIYDKNEETIEIEVQEVH